MNPNHVVSLELSKKLKEVGYPQEGEFFYCDTADKRTNKKLTNFMLYPNEIASARRYNTKNADIQFVAPLASELMKRTQIGRLDFDPLLHAVFVDEHMETDLNICNALAKMYIYLAGEGLLKK